MTKNAPRDRAADEDAAAGRQFDIEHSFAFRLVKLVNLMTREFQREFETELDVSLVEWRILAVLSRRPGLSAAEVSRSTGHNQMIIGRAVKRLEELGRIKRTPSPDDGRRYFLRMTTAGRRVFETISPLALQLDRNVTKDMSPQDILAIAGLLDAAIDRFDG